MLLYVQVGDERQHNLHEAAVLCIVERGTSTRILGVASEYIFLCCLVQHIRNHILKKATKIGVIIVVVVQVYPKEYFKYIIVSSSMSSCSLLFLAGRW